MTFGEIRSDHEISINVSSGDTRASFSTTAAFAEGDVLYVHPFRYEGNILSFSSPGIRIDMTVKRNKETPYYWRAVWITRGERNGRVYHVIHSKFDGAKVNRRSSLRVPVGTAGTVYAMLDTRNESVTIRDISATGLGFFAKGDGIPWLAKKSRLRVAYTDADSGYRVDVFCRVVRIQRRTDCVLYGCAFTRVYTEISRYIANKRIRGTGVLLR